MSQLNEFALNSPSFRNSSSKNSVSFYKKRYSLKTIKLRSSDSTNDEFGTVNNTTTTTTTTTTTPTTTTTTSTDHNNTTTARSLSNNTIATHRAIRNTCSDDDIEACR